MDASTSRPVLRSRPSSSHGPASSTHNLSPTTSRLPPPSLFMGPSSRNASHVSIPAPSNAPQSNASLGAQVLSPAKDRDRLPSLTRKRSQLSTITTSLPAKTYED